MNDESFNGDWGLGIGDWGLGVWAKSPFPIPKTPTPNPHFNTALKINFI